MPKRGPPHPTDIHVGQRVRMARVQIGMSQEGLGDAIGLTFQQVQKYEKGTNRIGASRLKQIADVSGKPVAWFYDGLPAAGATAKPGADLLGEFFASGRHALDLARAYLQCDGTAQRALVALAEAAARVSDAG